MNVIILKCRLMNFMIFNIKHAILCLVLKLNRLATVHRHWNNPDASKLHHYATFTTAKSQLKERAGKQKFTTTHFIKT